ncbi:hypothetical protein ARMGADRAFT_544615 [Armillaria gallica]|uniref:Uncharacterized protein n=1 Tax=Armillaria gallica TaxID=47427 RepID=A0A2H3CRZ2_ARMGA|nr:hypothetical protein ARMGADRAFT_544615 [Armillaria gallica]
MATHSTKHTTLRQKLNILGAGYVRTRGVTVDRAWSELFPFEHVMRSSGWSNLLSNVNEIHSERPQVKRTRHRVVKRDERRGQNALLSAHLLLSEIAGGRYVSFNEDFNVEQRKEVSFLDIPGLNVDLVLHDVMEMYICTFILSYSIRGT